MVAQRKKSKASTPLPATPNRKVSDPDSIQWIHAWLCGFTAAIASQADDLLPKLELLGFTSFDSLQYMNDIDDLRKIGLTNAHAQMLMKDAKALHANKESSSPSESPDPDKDKEKRFIAWSGKLEGIPGGPHNCARPELLRWLTALLCFIEAQCYSLGVHLREFCRDPGMTSSEFTTLHAKISPWQDRQLAAVILSSIPAAMAQHLASMIPDGLLAADGLVILQAVCSPHYGTVALKAQICAATELCLHNIPKLRHKNELQPALFNHIQALALLDKHGQPFGREMKISGLNTLVQPLLLGPELQAAADVVENAGGTWTPEHVTKILLKRASEWALLPTHKEVACASVFRHTTQCHKWLGPEGKCDAHKRGACRFAHDAEFKCRSDLLPNCPYLDSTGNCLNTAKLGC